MNPWLIALETSVVLSLVLVLSKLFGLISLPWWLVVGPLWFFAAVLVVVLALGLVVVITAAFGESKEG